MTEFLAHLAGDYVVQSDWMATEKTARALPAAAHAATYAACFLPLTRDPRTLAVIGGTHFLIDRYRVARFVCWAKNQAAPPEYRHRWDDHVRGTGYHRDVATDPPECALQAKPASLATWLMIAADNWMHLTINRWALRRWAERPEEG